MHQDYDHLRLEMAILTKYLETCSTVRGDAGDGWVGGDGNEDSVVVTAESSVTRAVNGTSRNFTASPY